MHERNINKKLVTLACLSALLSLSAKADQLFVNANGYTLNAKQKLQHFQALAVDEQGRVLSIGDAVALLKKYPHATRTDLAGKTVLTGLIDAHGHVLGLGIEQSQLGLRNTSSLAEAQKAIREYAEQFRQHQWILGRGWNQAVWKLTRFPTAAEIDVVLADRPAWLTRVDGHAGWANTRAMQLAGIDKNTPDPVGGKIERDAKGEATGIFIDSAMELIAQKLPAQNAAESKVALDAALSQLKQVGLTSVHDAGVSVEADQLYREYAEHKKLAPRVYGMIAGADGVFDTLSKQGPLASMGDDQYALRAVKLYADGALGSRGAAMLQAYTDAPQTKGLLFASDAQMKQQISKAALKGYQVNVHAIGDAGNRQVIESIAQLPESANAALLRHRIEHAQVLANADIPRLAQWHIIPSMQPSHATSDMNMAEDRIGKERLQGAYAWQKFLKQK
ncbi:MAG: amidohydrolase, partial [Undibacterium sp.]|nr:amidohydrolase [Undibacterium sp.]